MHALQTKCLAASTATHLLLILGVVVAPLIFVSEQIPKSLPALRLVSSRMMDEALARGPRTAPPLPAQPVVTPPAPTPQPPVQPVEPTPQPATKVQQAPPTVARLIVPIERPAPTTPSRPILPPESPTKVRKATPAPTPAKTTPAKPAVIPNTKAITKVLQDRSNEIARANAEKVRLAAEERLRKESAFSDLAKNIAKQFGSSTRIEVPGAGEALYADYAQQVQDAYRAAWKPPAELSVSSAQVTVEVVIARTGRVVMAKTRITQRSGVRALDDSVERALKLEFVEPFPEGAKDLERTFRIHFDLQAKAFSG